MTRPVPPHVSGAKAPGNWTTRALRDPSWHLAALLVLAITLGGGDASAGIRDMIVQLAAILIMALHPRAFADFFLHRRTWLAALVALSVLVPLVQLIPLPPGLWTSLPGREMVVKSLAASGIDMQAAPAWFPISLAPARTLTALLATLAPLTVIVTGSVLSAERRRWVANIAVLASAIVMVFGVRRLLYPTAAEIAAASGAAQINRLGGLIVNANTAALFFVSCLLLLIGFSAEPGSAAKWRRTGADIWKMSLRASGVVLMVLCTFLTKSRTGTVLLALPFGLFALQMLRGWLRPGPGEGRTGEGGKGDDIRGHARHKAPAPAPAPARRRHVLARVVPVLALGIIGLAALAVAAFGGGSRIGEISDRLTSGDDGKRAEIHLDALQAAGRYWPVGAGMGTFDEVFQVDESLEYLTPRLTGRAHMEFYEIALEAGVAALALAACWLAWILVATWKALRTWNWPALAGSGILFGCVAQSLMLFPLRTETMLALAAFAVVLLRGGGARASKPLEQEETP